MLKNARGNAMIEIVPLLAIFTLIVNFALGFFGVIHSGILNSIAARNYAFETFRNRSSLNYIRDNGQGQTDFTYTEMQQRFHGVTNDTRTDGLRFIATKRAIKFSEVPGVEEEKGLADRTKFTSIRGDQAVTDAGIEEGTNNVWIRTGYGICLTAFCGGD